MRRGHADVEIARNELTEAQEIIDKAYEWLYDFYCDVADSYARFRDHLPEVLIRFVDNVFDELFQSVMDLDTEETKDELQKYISGYHEAKLTDDQQQAREKLELYLERKLTQATAPAMAKLYDEKHIKELIKGSLDMNEIEQYCIVALTLDKDYADLDDLAFQAQLEQCEELVVEEEIERIYEQFHTWMSSLRHHIAARLDAYNLVSEVL